jgi:hypothetical protein
LLQELNIVNIATTNLFAYGGLPAGAPQPLTIIEGISLPAVVTFFAYISTPYWNVLPGGILGAQNCVAADIIAFDVPVPGGTTIRTAPPIISFGGKLGPSGAPANLHPSAVIGTGQFIFFRLQVWGTALEVAAQASVMFPI